MKKNHSFADMALSDPLQKKLSELSFTTPTEIQEKTIPLLLESSHIHMFGQAQTGTGKTLAFGLPLLERIDPSLKAPQALIVAPTRELAQQITKSIEPFAHVKGITITTIYGGASIEEQIATLRRGIQIVVGTPGRLNDHLDRRTMSFGKLKTLILDEADIMLDMGFREEIEIILNQTPANKEIWLFSATSKPGIQDLIKTHMPDTVSIRISSKGVSASTVKQYFTLVPPRHKLDALIRIIEYYPNFYGFIFCQTKILTSEVAEKLGQKGLLVGALHGDLSQGQRNAIVDKFKKRRLNILVATDVAARGIDIPDLTHVINYSVPEDQESYVHRIGRTGRAGKEGTAITLIHKRERQELALIEKRHQLTVTELALPTIEQIAQMRMSFLKQQFDTYVEHRSCEHEPLFDYIKTVLAPYDQETLQRIFAHHLYHAHIQDLAKQKELEETLVSTTEVSFGVGTDDNITSDDIRTLLLKEIPALSNNIIRLRTIKRKSFITTTPVLAQEIVDKFRNTKMGDLRLNPTIIVGDGEARPPRDRSSGGSRGFGGGSRVGSRGGRGSRFSSSEHKPHREGRYKESRPSEDKFPKSRKPKRDY